MCNLSVNLAKAFIKEQLKDLNLGRYYKRLERDFDSVYDLKLAFNDKALNHIDEILLLKGLLELSKVKRVDSDNVIIFLCSLDTYPIPENITTIVELMDLVHYYIRDIALERFVKNFN